MQALNSHDRIKDSIASNEGFDRWWLLKDDPLRDHEIESAIEFLSASPWGDYRDRGIWIGLGYSIRDERIRQLALRMIDDTSYGRRNDAVFYISFQYGELIPELVERYREDVDGELLHALAAANFDREPHGSVQTMVNLLDGSFSICHETWDSILLYIDDYEKTYNVKLDVNLQSADIDRSVKNGGSTCRWRLVSWRGSGWQRNGTGTEKRGQLKKGGGYVFSLSPRPFSPPQKPISCG